ncbi:MAG: AIPR family protein [Hyphomonas sp.]|uniref:AIPR family protein n=1 Tax=Hyphomonas sp. TaxID=87 RepID=UPI0025C48031|nr:AIPR family protein [Hyphomonas sp.]MBA4338772.1 AIPR family protein [Hyphomonas sp.]
MTENEIVTTFEEFRQEVLASAAANRDFERIEFLSAFGRELEACDEIEELNPCTSPNVRGVQIDGYGFNSDEGLDLFVADFEHRDTLETISRSEVATLVKRLTSFFSKALDGELHRTLEETSEVYAVARAVHERGKQLGRVRLYVLSERQLSDRYETIDVAQGSGATPVALHVWDMGRLHRMRSSRNQKEPIEIDVAALAGETLACLPAHLESDVYRSYLLAVPGRVLADLYARYGARLLEQNVRAFLQATNKANRGIRQTILDDPGMFFAYNNGVTATASAVEVLATDGVDRISRITDLQIVNGGQTTASLFHARRRDKADLSKVFVQMKLTVIDESRFEDVVPKISQFANTQNTVNAADFFANHPFHVRMETFSRRLWARPANGDGAETLWYYERIRGQYAEEQSKLDARGKRLFLQQNPKSQLLRKTDLAKYENLWDDDPVQVNLGAQKNFALYAVRIGEAWKAGNTAFDEDYFRRVVIRAIIFRESEKLVSAQPWYEGGYRANIVNYAIALISRALESEGLELDVARLWQHQACPRSLSAVITDVSALVNSELTGPNRGQSNISEWAKRPKCWETILVNLPKARQLVRHRSADWTRSLSRA